MGGWGALGAPAGDEPDLWGGDARHHGRTEAGAFVPAVSVDVAECAAVDSALAASHLDRVWLSDPEAPVGHRGLPGAQRRGLLWARGVTADGMLCPVLHHAGCRQRAHDDGRDRLESEALLAFCGLRSPGVTRTFMEYRAEDSMNAG